MGYRGTGGVPFIEFAASSSLLPKEIQDVGRAGTPSSTVHSYYGKREGKAPSPRARCLIANPQR
jgi:hypothetical protein